MVPIKYASEKTERSGDPVANNVYFFNKVIIKSRIIDKFYILYWKLIILLYMYRTWNL